MHLLELMDYPTTYYMQFTNSTEKCVSKWLFYKNGIPKRMFDTAVAAKNELRYNLFKSVTDNNPELCDCFIKRFDDIIEYHGPIY